MYESSCLVCKKADKKQRTFEAQVEIKKTKTRTTTVEYDWAV